MLSVSDTVNRFLTVCEDIYDKRVTDSSGVHNAAVAQALTLYLQRLQLLVRAGKLPRDTYKALVTVYEKDDITLREYQVTKWNEVLANVDAAPDFPMTARGDDVKRNYISTINLSDVPNIQTVVKVLRQNIANLD